MFEQEMSLDVTPGGVPPLIYASQYDNGRSVRINLSNRGGSVGQLNGDSVSWKIFGTLPSGTPFEEDLESSAVRTDYLIVPITEQMTPEDGDVTCSVCYLSGTTRINTLVYILHVQKMPSIVDGD